MADRPRQHAAPASAQAQRVSTAPAQQQQEGQSRAAFNGYVRDLQSGPPAQAQAADPSVQDGQQLAQKHTENLSLSVGGNLPANRLLSDNDGTRVKTGGATHFSVGVARTGFDARFAPGLEIRPGDWKTRWATGGITLSSLYYSFASGKVSLSMDTGVSGDILSWFYDVQGGIEQTFTDKFRAVLPERLKKPGYDPYADQELPALLQQIVSSLSGGFGGAGAAPGGKDVMDDVTQPEMTAWVQLKPMETKLGEDYKLTVKDRASLSVRAILQGNAKGALKDPKLQRLEISADGISLEHKTAGVLSQVRVRNLVFGPGLSLDGLDYDLGLEDVASVGKLLALLAQMHTGQDLGVRDQNAVRMEAIRRDIDTQARAKLPEMMREQVRAHDKVIPGYSLVRMVGEPKART